jgi:uncharacterized protein YndB with AHSA1/START domain
MKPNLSFERHLRHSPERVWKALTDRTILSRWYLDNDFSPVVGHRFTFRPAPETGFHDILCGEVILVDEPHQLVYTFQGGPMKRPTTVTWTLTPEGTGTLLTLQHTGFSDMADTVLNNVMIICPSRFLDRLPDVLTTVLLVEV